MLELMSSTPTALTWPLIEEARERIAGKVNVSPVLTSRTLDGLSGSAVAAKSLKPAIRVIGVEPAGADDAARSLRAGRIVPVANPKTIADGLRATIGERPLAEIRRIVEDIITVTDESIVRAMRQLWDVMKIVVEPSGAVPYAALLDTPQALRGRRIGIILSGGNLDLDRLPWSAAAADGVAGRAG